ncbi:O-antigen ligase family protein [Kosmotoga pacifica]|nr:O-antigen ligase family protein [Kosmotoga pacifica]
MVLGSTLVLLGLVNGYNFIPGMKNIRLGELLLIIVFFWYLVFRKIYFNKKLTTFFVVLFSTYLVSIFLNLELITFEPQALFFNLAGLFLISLPFITIYSVQAILIETFNKFDLAMYLALRNMVFYIIIAVSFSETIIALTDYKLGFFSRLVLKGTSSSSVGASRLGNFLALSLIIIEAIIIHKRIEKKSKGILLVLSLALFTNSFGVFATFSRSAWINWGVGSLVLALMSKFRVKIKLFYIILLLILIVHFITGGQLFLMISKAFSVNNPGVYLFSRFYIWKDVLSIYKNNPTKIFEGIGVGNYYLISNVYENTKRGLVRIGSSHNQYLDIMNSSGILGLFVFVGLLIWFLQKGKIMRDTFIKNIYYASILGFAASSFFGDFIIHDPRNAGFLAFTSLGYFWVILGIGLSQLYVERALTARNHI